MLLGLVVGFFPLLSNAQTFSEFVDSLQNEAVLSSSSKNDSIRDYYGTGQLKTIKNYKNGKLNGIQKGYYKSVLDDGVIEISNTNSFYISNKRN